LATGLRGHARAEAVPAGADKVGRLKCTFHDRAPSAFFSRAAANTWGWGLRQGLNAENTDGQGELRAASGDGIGIMRPGILDELKDLLTGHWRPITVIGLIILALVLMFVTGLTPAGLADTLRENRQEWQIWVAAHPLLAALAYAVFYMLAVSISLPGALWFTIGAGFLLGAGPAIPVSLIGVTVGATNIFLIARYLAGDTFHERFDGRVARFAAGFRRDELTYVILLRMTPTPFFVVNIAAALLGARLRTYVVGTLIGALPATVLYANLGAGLGDLIDAGARPGWDDLARPAFLIVLVMALLLALVPLAHRAWRQRAGLSDKSP
jgi:uncharacterized membrane protein YdjX (TVP38/TMEM64 family)